MTRPTTLIGAVGVVGAGAVGQSVATALVTAGIADQLLVASRTIEQAAALARDLDDMRHALGAPVRPHAAPLVDLRDCCAIVVALRARFTNTRSRDIRMGGLAANAPAVRAIGETMRGYCGTVLVVTNPVDLMSRLLADTSGCTRVFGIGSNLDTARYRLTLARLLDVPTKTVQGHVIGEHGDGAVVCASSTTIDGRPAPVPLPQVRHELARRSGLISAGIGRTRCGPAGAVLSTLRKTLGLVDGVEELSTAHDGGWLGIPVQFTAGQPTPCPPALDADEAHAFAAADTKLRIAYQALGPHLPADSTTTERTS